MLLSNYTMQTIMYNNYCTIPLIKVHYPSLVPRPSPMQLFSAYSMEFVSMWWNEASTTLAIAALISGVVGTETLKCEVDRFFFHSKGDSP